jgi:Periplasmic serine proteases (ClpP class)
MKLVHLAHKLSYSAWYILPSYHRTLLESVKDWETTVGSAKQEELADMAAFFINQRAPMEIDSNGIATINISGALGRNLAPIDKVLGMSDYADIENEVVEAGEKGAIAVLFDVDSPGGEVQGTAETAQIIAGLTVPTASFSAGLDASAAYYLSSSVNRKFATPSSIIGSIGTILPWIDSAKMFDAFGLSWEPIVGEGEDFKGAGMGPSLTDSQREYLQETVNAASGAFQKFVSQNRNLNFEKLKAGAYHGEQALKLNLIDQIGSYDDAYQYLIGRT